MQKLALVTVVSLFFLVGCATVLEGPDVEASVSVRGQAVNVDQEFEIGLLVKVDESKVQVPYKVSVVGSMDSGASKELFSVETVGDFSDTVVVALPEPGLWQLQARIENLEAVDPVAESELELMIAFRSSEVALSFGSSPSVWLTNQSFDLPVEFSVPDQIDDLVIRLEERQEGSWIEIGSVEGSEQPRFERVREEEGVRNYRLSAYSGQILLVHSPEVEIEFFTPERMIRDLYYRLSQASTGAEEFAIVQEDTYPGLQAPSERDRSRYSRLSALVSVVPLLETLDTSPNWVLKNDWPCSTRELLTEPLPGIHFVHDIEQNGSRFTVHASFLDGKMYYHRGLCW